MNKADLRFNEVREAIINIASAMENCSISNRAVAVLINDANKSLRISQVEGVLSELTRLEEKYVNHTKEK